MVKAALGFLLGLSTAIVIWLGPNIKRAIFHRDRPATPATWHPKQRRWTGGIEAENPGW